MLFFNYYVNILLVVIYCFVILFQSPISMSLRSASLTYCNVININFASKVILFVVSLSKTNFIVDSTSTCILGRAEGDSSWSSYTPLT